MKRHQESETQPVSLAGMSYISEELVRKLLIMLRLPLGVGQCRTSIKANAGPWSLIHFTILLLENQVRLKSLLLLLFLKNEAMSQWICEIIPVLCCGLPVLGGEAGRRSGGEKVWRGEGLGLG